MSTRPSRVTGAASRLSSSQDTVAIYFGSDLFWERSVLGAIYSGSDLFWERPAGRATDLEGASEGAPHAETLSDAHPPTQLGPSAVAVGVLR